MTKKAIVLLSGGLDSTTVLAIAQDQGFDCYALSFRYGQRHDIELKAASNIAEKMNVIQHLITDIDLRQIGGSALTGDIEVPRDRDMSKTDREIPVTYVPARNTIFLSFALAWAEVLHAYDIFIGVNAVDYSGYPDCRPQYISAYQDMANLATKASVEGHHNMRIHTPLIELTKSKIIKLGTRLGVDYSLTSSCYDPSDEGQPCHHCDSCLLRARGFTDAGLQDPLIKQFLELTS